MTTRQPMFTFLVLLSCPLQTYCIAKRDGKRENVVVVTLAYTFLPFPRELQEKKFKKLLKISVLLGLDNFHSLVFLWIGILSFKNMGF